MAPHVSVSQVQVILTVYEGPRKCVTHEESANTACSACRSYYARSRAQPASAVPFRQDVIRLRLREGSQGAPPPPPCPFPSSFVTACAHACAPGRSPPISVRIFRPACRSQAGTLHTVAVNALLAQWWIALRYAAAMYYTHARHCAGALPQGFGIEPLYWRVSIKDATTGLKTVGIRPGQYNTSATLLSHVLGFWLCNARLELT